MNLEQIVKETVAKFVAEKQGKDLTGDGKIDSKDYLKARSNAIEKATMKNEGDSEDHEVSMAQNSLDSILRSAMELKAKIGDNEINIPAWIQDHISNSENYIDQASCDWTVLICLWWGWKDAFQHINSALRRKSPSHQYLSVLRNNLHPGIS